MKTTTRILTIKDQSFALPVGMSQKDIQQLAGFLVTLPALRQVYSSDYQQTFMYPESCTLSLGEAGIYLNREEAQAAADAASEAIKAKRLAEEAKQET